MPDIYRRTGGPFLDQIELEDREIKAAKAEGREPDFSLANIAPLVDHTVTFEVDLTDAAAVAEVVTIFQNAVAKAADTAPASLLPGVYDAQSADGIPEVDNEHLQSPVLGDPEVPPETAFGPGIKLSEAPEETFAPVVPSKKGKST